MKCFLYSTCFFFESWHYGRCIECGMIIRIERGEEEWSTGIQIPIIIIYRSMADNGLRMIFKGKW